MDVSARYQANSRLSFIATLPIVFNSFSMIYPPDGVGNGLRYDSHPEGIGDLSLYGESWLLNGKKHPFHNVAVGCGLKIPTGNWNYKSMLPDLTGNNFAVRSVYPPSIMPGDGGFGIIVGYQGYRLLRNELPIIHGATVYSSGSYMITPQDTNTTPSMAVSLGVPLNASFANRMVNSIADSYSARVGIAIKIPGTWDKKNLKGLRFRIEGNSEGIMTRDLFGRSDGFRQPGYVMSVGPGLTYARGRDLFMVDVPIVFNRHINPTPNNLPDPGVPVDGNPPQLTYLNGPQNAGQVGAPTNFGNNIGLVPRVSLSLRYVRAF
jgi:hypothetical protein